MGECKAHDWELVVKLSAWYLKCKACGAITEANGHHVPIPPWYKDTWTKDILIPSKE